MKFLFLFDFLAKMSFITAFQIPNSMIGNWSPHIGHSHDPCRLIVQPTKINLHFQSGDIEMELQNITIHSDHRMDLFFANIQFKKIPKSYNYLESMKHIKKIKSIYIYGLNVSVENAQDEIFIARYKSRQEFYGTMQFYRM